MNDSKERLIAEMIRHEHQRWNQWAIAFFGAITGVFILRDKTDSPLWAAHLIASFISVMWTFSAIAIRRSTLSWWLVAEEISNRTDCGNSRRTVLALFMENNKGFEPWKDLRNCILPFVVEEDTCRTTLFSVTGTLVRAGVLCSLAFLLTPTVAFIYFLKALLCG